MTTRNLAPSSVNVSRDPKSLVYTLTELVNDLAASVNEQRTDHATFRTVVGDIKTLVNDIRAKLNAMSADAVVSSAGLAIGSTPQNVANKLFLYSVAGVMYAQAADAVGTAPGDDIIPQNKYGAVAFDIGADGTVDAVEATGNAAGYDSAGEAVAGIPAAAADHARMGNVTAMKSDGAFTFGTTALNAANTTVAYTSTPGALAGLGAAVATSPPDALAAAAVDDISLRGYGAP